MAAPTQYYFSQTLGNDANSGLIPGSPKQTLAAALTLYQNGNSISQARGDKWRPLGYGSTFGFFSPTISTHNGQIWNSYDAGLGSDLPVWDTMIYDDGAGWTNIGAGRWSKDMTTLGGIYAGLTGLVGRCWPAMTGPSSPPNREAFRLMGSAAACVAIRQFYVTGTTITIYTGSTNPFVYYGGIALAARFGSSNLFGRFQSFNGETFSEVLIRGSGGTAQNTNRFVTFNDVQIICPGDAGGFGTAATGDVVSDWTIRRFYCDFYTSSTEDRADSSPFGSWNGLSFVSTDVATDPLISRMDVVDAYVRGARHAGLQFATISLTQLDNVKGITIRSSVPGGTVLDEQDVDYGHGLAVTAAGFLIQGVKRTGGRTQDQIMGAGRITGCVWKNASGPAASNASNFGTCNYVSISSYAYTTALCDIDIDGCVFNAPSNFAIQINPTTSGSIAQGKLRITNTTFVETTASYASKTTWQPDGNPGGSLHGACIVCGTFAADATLPFPDLKNNLYIIPTGETIVALWAHQAGNSGGGTGTYYASPNPPASSYFNMFGYTANDSPPAASLPGATAAVVSNNATYASATAAGVDSSSFKPTSASPLYHAGAVVTLVPDGAGSSRYQPPTTGALEATS